jgi:hypothetical protein
MTDRLHEAFEAFEQSLPLTPAKPWYASRGVWGGLVAAGAGIAGVLGYAVTPTEQAAVLELVVAVGGVAGGMVAMLGRVKAKRVIR